MQPYPVYPVPNLAVGTPQPALAPSSASNQARDTQPMLAPSSTLYALGNAPSTASAPSLSYAQQQHLLQANRGPAPALTGRGTLPPTGRLTAAQAAYLNQNPLHRPPRAVQGFPIPLYPAGDLGMPQRVQPGGHAVMQPVSRVPVVQPVNHIQVQPGGHLPVRRERPGTDKSS